MRDGIFFYNKVGRNLKIGGIISEFRIKEMICNNLLLLFNWILSKMLQFILKIYFKDELYKICR